MTVLTRNPDNTNLLHPNKFVFTCSRLPNLQYFAQSLNIPGISMSEAYQPTPFVDLYPPGDKAIFDMFFVTFLVDEELTAWTEVYDWIWAMTFPTNFDDYGDLSTLFQQKTGYQKEKFPQYADTQITLLSSSNNPIIKFHLKDCYPTSLSNFPVSTTDSPDNVITADVTFRFSYFTIERL